MFINIPKNVLSIVLGESYPDGDYTLDDELGDLKNKITWVKYAVNENTGLLTNFQCYTDDYICLLIDNIMCEQYLLKIDRNPPK